MQTVSAAGPGAGWHGPAALFVADPCVPQRVPDRRRRAGARGEATDGSREHGVGVVVEAAA
eukprot:SAG11_NODE_2196_length_3699_cov_2.962222_3_plen_61_part_00